MLDVFFYFFFILAFIALGTGLLFKNPIFFFVGALLLTVLGALLAGSGIDVPTNVTYTRDGAGDITASLTVFQNYSGDTNSASFDFSIWIMHMVFMYGGFLALVASIVYAWAWLPRFFRRTER